jgi:hypothetical protein
VITAGTFHARLDQKWTIGFQKAAPGYGARYRDWTPPRVRHLLKAVREGASLSLPAQVAIAAIN